MIHDAYCRGVVDGNPSKLVAWWIMAAWAYEVASAPILSDAAFDRLAVELDEKWDSVEHPHKALLDRSALKSALGMRGAWPRIAISAATTLICVEASPPPAVPRPAHLSTVAVVTTAAAVLGSDADQEDLFG